MSSEVLAPRHELPATLLDLESILTPEGAVFASNGEMYRSMFFARDSIESADDLLRIKKDISENVIIKLSELQGVENNPVNAEEPGRIPHQHMKLHGNDGQRISESAEMQMRILSEKWGGDEYGFTYYGSLDATPMYARLVARHVLVHGSEILDREVANRSGQTVKVAECFRQALDWMRDHLSSSELGLLEFRRLSDEHIIVQSWRDSGSAFIHEDGTQANIDGYIAPLEVQGYAYDAFKLATMIDGASELDKQKWSDIAAELQHNVLTKFWMSDKNQFAMGIDRDEEWQPRQIKTPSSSQGVFMDSRILIDLPEDLREHYITGIVENLFGPDFLTEVGVRCRSLAYAKLVDFADYHGSMAVWAKEVYDFAKGLRRQGLNRLATDMESRVLNGVNVSGNHYELLYVNADGEVDYNPKRYVPGMQVDEVTKSTVVPDKSQAWTIAAVLAIKRGARPKYHADLKEWSRNLEDKILSEIKSVKPLTAPEDIEDKRRKSKNFAIDIEAGIEADKRWNPSWWQ